MPLCLFRIASLALVLFVLLRSIVVDAQPVPRVVGTVRDGITDAPISGAVVTLLDADRVMQRRTVTGTRGEYRLERTVHSTRMQLLRLGYRPREILLPSVSPRDTTLDVMMERLPNLLDGMRVTARAACPARADTPVAFSLWEQARSALLAAVVTRESQSVMLRRYSFDRETDGERATRMTVVTDSATGTMASFTAALTPAGFVHSGFVRDSADDRVYFGPDAEVLLSDAFLDGYCMQLAKTDPVHPERVGVRFTPARRRTDRVEIDGTLWIDSARRSLSHIDYEYLVPDGRLRALRPGGQVVFGDMPNGSILIDHWSMRLAGFVMESDPGVPSMTVRSGRRAEVSGGAAKRLVSVINETGGALAEARWRDSTQWRGRFGSLLLRVLPDSTQSLVGRELRLSRSPYRARIDSTGHARFAELIAGPYEVFLADERLRAIGLELAVPVPGAVRRGDSLNASVRVPTAESFVTERCQRAKQWRDGDRPLLLIRIVSETGNPVEGARVSIAWESAEGGWQDASRDFTTGADGVATYCASAAAVGRPARISARMRNADPGVFDVQFGGSLQMVPLVVRPQN